MLASLGLFVFDMSTLPFEEMQRRADWRHDSVPRFRKGPSKQFLGDGDDTLTIEGRLVPEIAGKASAIETLRTMAKAGDDYQLIDGAGTVFGSYIIVRLDERKKHFLDNGKPRSIDFAIDLERLAD